MWEGGDFGWGNYGPWHPDDSVRCPGTNVALPPPPLFSVPHLALHSRKASREKILSIRCRASES